MTTPTNPDGQPNSADAGQQPTQPAAQPPAAPAPTPPAPVAPAKDRYEEYRGIPIRDFADAKQAIDRKIELEEENRRLQMQVAELATLRSSSAELSAKVVKMERAGRRRESMDVILDGAHPEHSSMLGLLADGMHARGEVDLEAEQTKEAGKKAREKLAKLFPSHYRAQDGAPAAGQPGAALHSYAGVKAWTDLTPEQQRSISKEDFARLFGSGAGGNGVGVLVRRR
jgi:hypothetical protein